jgi:hypothetical protein
MPKIAGRLTNCLVNRQNKMFESALGGVRDTMITASIDSTPSGA